MAGVNGATLIICAASTQQLDEMLEGVEDAMPQIYEEESIADRLTDGSIRSSLSRVFTGPARPKISRPQQNKSLRRLSMATGADRCEIQAPAPQGQGRR